MISVFGFNIDLFALSIIGLYVLSFVWIAIIAIINHINDKNNQ